MFVRIVPSDGVIEQWALRPTDPPGNTHCDGKSTPTGLLRRRCGSGPVNRLNTVQAGGDVPQAYCSFFLFSCPDLFFKPFKKRNRWRDLWRFCASVGRQFTAPQQPSSFPIPYGSGGDQQNWPCGTVPVTGPRLRMDSAYTLGHEAGDLCSGVGCVCFRVFLGARVGVQFGLRG